MDGSSCILGTDRWEIPETEGWEETRTRWEREPWNCHDCGVRPGGYHHLGCALETCPCGKSQAIMCDHFEQRLQAQFF
jgi:hypothetical protein